MPTEQGWISNLVLKQNPGMPSHSTSKQNAEEASFLGRQRAQRLLFRDEVEYRTPALLPPGRPYFTHNSSSGEAQESELAHSTHLQAHSHRETGLVRGLCQPLRVNVTIVFLGELHFNDTALFPAGDSRE